MSDKPLSTVTSKNGTLSQPHRGTVLPTLPVLSILSHRVRVTPDTIRPPLQVTVTQTGPDVSVGSIPLEPVPVHELPLAKLPLNPGDVFPVQQGLEPLAQINAYNLGLSFNFDPVIPSDNHPFMDGTPHAGVSPLYSRWDHVHPSDDSRLPIAGGQMQGPLALVDDPISEDEAVTKRYADNLLANAGAIPSNDIPIVEGTGAPGSDLEYSRADHVHPHLALVDGGFF